MFDHILARHRIFKQDNVAFGFIKCYFTFIYIYSIITQFNLFCSTIVSRVTWTDLFVFFQFQFSLIQIKKSKVALIQGSLAHYAQVALVAFAFGLQLLAGLKR